MTDQDQQEHRLAVIGGGVMGTNIAALGLGHGVPVVLVEVDDEHAEAARLTVRQKLKHAQLLGVLPAGREQPRLVTSTSLSDITGASTVVEAVTEITEIKAKVLTEVGGLVQPGTLLISNTSCIPIDEMAAWVPRPDELVGVHFMNPAYLIEMVEVIRGSATSQATLTRVTEFLTALGRSCLVVNDAPGFVINRLLHPLINRAAMLVQDGVASAEVVDGLLEGCLGHATGPLHTADLIGIDNLVDSLVVLHERTGDPECRPCELMLELVRDGHHGRKTGRGFFDYRKVAQ